MHVLMGHFLSLEIANLRVYFCQILDLVLMPFESLPVEAVAHTLGILLYVKILEPVFDVPLDPKMLWQFTLIAAILETEAVIVMQWLDFKVAWDH